MNACQVNVYIREHKSNINIINQHYIFVAMICQL